MTTTVSHVITGATATANSVWIPVNGAAKVSFFFKRSDHSAGSTAFSVAVSPDATVSVTYARLIDNVANTNAETIKRVSSVSLSSNTTVYCSMSPEDVAGFIKVTATETTDGTHDAWVVLQYND